MVGGTTVTYTCGTLFPDQQDILTPVGPCSVVENKKVLFMFCFVQLSKALMESKCLVEFTPLPYAPLLYVSSSRCIQIMYD